MKRQTLRGFVLARIADDELCFRTMCTEFRMSARYRNRLLDECAARRELAERLDASGLAILARPYRDHPGFRDEWEQTLQVGG